MKHETTLSRTRGRGATLTTSDANFRRLERAQLPQCPFSNYSALDLIRDLVSMYEYLIPYGEPVALDVFLTATHDAHAAAYMDILTA